MIMKNKISDLEEGEKIVHIEHGKCIVKEKLSCALYLHGLENKFKGLVSQSILIDWEKTNELNNNINMDKISEEIISIIKDSKDGIIKQEYLIDKLNKYEENIIIIGINGLIVEGILSCNRLLPDNELYVYMKNIEQSQTSALLKEEKIEKTNNIYLHLKLTGKNADIRDYVSYLYEKENIRFSNKKIDGKFYFDYGNNFCANTELCGKVNFYIVSNLEIKKNVYCLINNILCKTELLDGEIVSRNIYGGGTMSICKSEYFEILLTTDSYLIDNGVKYLDKDLLDVLFFNNINANKNIQSKEKEFTLKIDFENIKEQGKESYESNDLYKYFLSTLDTKDSLLNLLTSALLKEEKIDNISDYAYYGGNDNPYEVIKVCEAWGLDKDAYLFKIVKYVARAGKKDKTKEIEDLEKARYYLDRKINNLKNK